MTVRMAHLCSWLVALLPVVVACFGMDFPSLDRPGAWLNILGRLTGVAALSLLLMAAILSARVPGFDRPFGGLTKLWQTHHQMGAVALLCVLAHPVLLALAAAEVSLSVAVTTLFPPFDHLATWLGWLALIGMVVFLAPSFHFLGEPEYGRWKWLHRLSGPVIVLALIHTFMLSRTMPGYATEMIWTIMAALAVAAVSWRFVISRRAGRLRYRVDAVDRPANNVVELKLLPAGRRQLHYEVGQFVYLVPYDRRLAAGYGEEHPYTLSSSPLEAGLRIAIKDLGDASRAIQHISPDSEVTIEGPYGRFFTDNNPGGELWIAGGIGITPFLARARHLARTGETADIHLVYCVQDEARALFATELAELAETLEGFKLSLHYFYRQGPLTGEFLSAECPDLAQRTAYVCGPLPLNQLAVRIVREAGIPVSRIHTEEFNLI